MLFNIVDMIDSHIINNGLGSLSVNQRSCLQKLMTTLIDEFEGLRIDGTFPELNTDTFYHICKGINTDKIEICLINKKRQNFLLTISNEKITMVEIKKYVGPDGKTYSRKLPSGFSLNLDVKSNGNQYKLNTCYNDYLISVENDSNYSSIHNIKIYDKNKIDKQGGITGIEPIEEKTVEIKLDKGTVLEYPQSKKLFEMPQSIKSILSYGKITVPYYLGKVYGAIYNQKHRNRDNLITQLKKYVEKKDKVYRLRDKEICWIKDMLDSKLDILAGLELDEDYSNKYSSEQNVFIVRNAKGKRFKLSLLDQCLELFELPESIKDYELSKFASRKNCYHNGFMLCYSPTDCSIKYVSDDDVVYVSANHLDIQGKRTGQNPQIMGGVIYDVDLYTNTADMSFPTDAFTSDYGMTVVERDEKTNKLERYFVPKHKMIESDYNGRFTLASNYATDRKK